MDGRQFLIFSHLTFFAWFVAIHVGDSASIRNSDQVKLKHSVSARSPSPLFPALAVVNQLREIKNNGEVRRFPADGPPGEDFVDVPPFDAGVGKIDEPGNGNDYDCGPMSCEPDVLNPEGIGNSPLPPDLGPHEHDLRLPLPMQMVTKSTPVPTTSSPPSANTTAAPPNEAQTSRSGSEESVSPSTTQSSSSQASPTEQSTLASEQDTTLSTSALVEAVTSTTSPMPPSKSPASTSASSQTESMTEPTTAIATQSEVTEFSMSSTEQPASSTISSDLLSTSNSTKIISEEGTTPSPSFGSMTTTLSTTTDNHIQKDSAESTPEAAESGAVSTEALSNTTTDSLSSTSSTKIIPGEIQASKPSSEAAASSTDFATTVQTLNTENVSGDEFVEPTTPDTNSDLTILSAGTTPQIDSDTEAQESVSSAPETVDKEEEEATEEDWSPTTESDYEINEETGDEAETSTASQNYDYEASTSPPESDEVSEGTSEEELGDIRTESYDDFTTLEPEVTVVQPQKLSHVTLQSNSSFNDRECKFEDVEKFKRNIRTATFGYNLKSEPSLITFVDRSPCVATFSDAGHDKILSTRRLWPTLNRRLSINAAGFADGCVYFVESGKGAEPQLIQRFNYNTATKAYEESSDPISAPEFLRSVCGIEANQMFIIKSFLKLPNSSTCFVFNERSRNALVSPNATATELSLAHSIEHLLHTEYVNHVQAIFVWADEPSLSIVYVYGSNGELYVVHRNMMRNSPEFGLWKAGNYVLIPYEQFPA